MADNIKKQLPENIDYEGTKKILSVEPSPLNVVLLQEVRPWKQWCDDDDDDDDDDGDVNSDNNNDAAADDDDNNN